jgi:2,4-diaminopentanoate dehydrogenase
MIGDGSKLEAVSGSVGGAVGGAVGQTIAVVVVGAGPIGQGVAREISSRPHLKLAGVVDIAPDKIGQTVAGATIAPTFPDGAQVAVLTTTSSLSKLEPQVMAALARGLAVVSSCEELAWPFEQPAPAARIDAAAREAGVAVLGTGVNPGFLMDALPLALTAPCRRVEHVRVERVQDAASRRSPFQHKVGVGLAPAEAERALEARAIGHVGLRESALLLGAGLGFPLDHFEEERRVVVAAGAVERHGRRVEAGQVLGVEQIGRGARAGVPRIELCFRAVFGADDVHDRVLVLGEPPLDVTFAGGVPGDIATCAIIVNAIPAVLEARPGLRTMAEVPVCWRA